MTANLTFDLTFFAATSRYRDISVYGIIILFKATSIYK